LSLGKNELDFPLREEESLHSLYVRQYDAFHEVVRDVESLQSAAGDITASGGKPFGDVIGNPENNFHILQPSMKGLAGVDGICAPVARFLAQSREGTA
jgi:hypothetical protein